MPARDVREGGDAVMLGRSKVAQGWCEDTVRRDEKQEERSRHVHEHGKERRHEQIMVGLPATYNRQEIVSVLKFGQTILL